MYPPASREHLRSDHSMTNPNENSSCEECHGKLHGAGSKENNIQDIQAEIGTAPEYTPVAFTTGTSPYPQVPHVVPIPVEQETDGIDDDLPPTRKNRQRLVAGFLALVFFILPMLASAVLLVQQLIESVKTEQVEHQDSK